MTSIHATPKVCHIITCLKTVVDLPAPASRVPRIPQLVPQPLDHIRRYYRYHSHKHLFQQARRRSCTCISSHSHISQARPPRPEHAARAVPAPALRRQDGGCSRSGREGAQATDCDACRGGCEGSGCEEGRGWWSEEGIEAALSGKGAE